MNESLNGLEGFFVKVVVLLDEAEKNYGIANHNYTDYALERMEMTLSTCLKMQHILLNASLDSEMQEYCSTSTELISCIQFIYSNWCEYDMRAFWIPGLTFLLSWHIKQVVVHHLLELEDLSLI